MTSTQLQIPGYVAGDWTIDAVHSHVGFVIKHMMVSKVRGHFAALSGRITTAPNPLDSTVTVSIEANSIDTGNSMRDDHVRSADFFEVESHPNITFASTGLRYVAGEYLIDGDLTIRGTTKPVSLTVETPEFGPNPQGGTKAGFSATTQINRSDFGVSYNGPIPGGGTALGEKVQVILEVEGDLDAAPSLADTTV
jgi:polyisoprenoid-binding protein YceI